MQEVTSEPELQTDDLLLRRPDPADSSVDGRRFSFESAHCIHSGVRICEQDNHSGGRSNMSDLERRTLPVEDADVEVRQTDDGDEEFVLTGHAAVFNSRSKPLGPPGHRFVEQIEPGAFSAALENSDIRALFNHDPSELLARESAGTLDVDEDNEGLRYEARLGDDSRSEFVKSKVERGEVTGNSFSFVVSEENESWNNDPEDSDLPVRTIHEFDRVDDLGPVSYPAYPEAQIADRAEKRAAELNDDSDEDAMNTNFAESLRGVIDLKADADLPQPSDPRQAERDRQWQEFLAENVKQERNAETEDRQSRPEFDCTEDISPDWADGEWDRPNLDDHSEADGDETWDNLDAAERQQIAARFIDGTADADNYGELSYPVVNPDTGCLNRNGLLAARQRAAAEDDEEVESIADELWAEHYEEEENSRTDLLRRRLRTIGG